MMGMMGVMWGWENEEEGKWKRHTHSDKDSIVRSVVSISELGEHLTVDVMDSILGCRQ